jgi:hypothetical protein
VKNVQVCPIEEADVGPVARFLHENLNKRVPARTWAAAMSMPWVQGAPNHGFMLRHSADVVGAYLAFYSQRRINGRWEKFCNLGAWCVLPEYRVHALRLLRALISQSGYHFTDLSPSGNVITINARLGFRHLNGSVWLVPNLPWPCWPGRNRIIKDRGRIVNALREPDVTLYKDHEKAAAAHHLVLIRRTEHCYVVFRRDRRRGLPVFASVLYVSNADLFRQMMPVFSRHVLVRHRLLGTLVDERLVSSISRPALRMRRPRPKMYLAAGLDGRDIDYLYSELALVPW